MSLIRQLVGWLAVAYPVTLMLLVAALRFGSDHLWQADLGLYIPRLIFAAPLPILTLLLIACRWWRMLWSLVVSAWLVLFPLMGLVLPGWPRDPHDPGRTLRVLSYNGNFARGGQEALASEVLAIDPEVAVFQQLVFTDRMTIALRASHPYQRVDGEFFIASRFPIRSATIPPRIPLRDRTRSPRFIRYELATRSGPIALYSVHPISPQYQLYAARTGGLRHAILSGALWSLAPRPDIDGDRELRTLQTQAFARMATHDALPTIIAGDTNLPKLSAALSSLSAFHDGFEEAGHGFGYTFPSRWAWMRIDRIFASSQFRFISFGVGGSLVSDHRPVYATLEQTH